MINTVYELITNVMAKQYPDRVAFRYVAADGKTVVEKTYAQYVQDIRRAVTYFKENIPDIKGKRKPYGSWEAISHVRPLPS